MNRSEFINSLCKLGASQVDSESHTECAFNTSVSSELYFVVWVYEEGDCTLAALLKSDPDKNLAYMQFELEDYDNCDSLFEAAISKVKSVKSLGLTVKSERGLFSQRITATYGNGRFAFGCKYFRYGGFDLPEKTGALGSIVAADA